MGTVRKAAMKVQQTAIDNAMAALKSAMKAQTAAMKVEKTAIGNALAATKKYLKDKNNLKRAAKYAELITNMETKTKKKLEKFNFKELQDLAKQMGIDRSVLPMGSTKETIFAAIKQLSQG